jgi:hypothetical protein
MGLLRCWAAKKSKLVQVRSPAPGGIYRPVQGAAMVAQTTTGIVDAVPSEDFRTFAATPVNRKSLTVTWPRRHGHA